MSIRLRDDEPRLRGGTVRIYAEFAVRAAGELLRARRAKRHRWEASFDHVVELSGGTPPHRPVDQAGTPPAAHPWR